MGKQEGAVAARGAHNLPAPLTSLVGRGTEVKAIADALRKSRLVTVAGPGGVGKTRVALEVARGEAGRSAAGVWLIDLASVSEGADVAAEAARTLGIGTRGDRTWTQALTRYLTDRSPLLLLDNCEHVIEASAALAATVLTSCPSVRVLTTSREVLDVPGERVWRLEPLTRDEALRLFAERARARRAGFETDRRADDTIGEICERLDRLPLAIELAAARVSAMSVEELHAELESELGGLGGGRLAPARHRTMRAAVEWGYSLLDETEQEALCELAVLVGGFDADAAIAVAPRLTADALPRLVDKSLVSAAESPTGRTRYRLLETVREFALDRLRATGDLEAARERHFRHFSALAPPGEEGWPSPEAPQLVRALEDDYENVRAAAEFAAETKPCDGLPFLAGAWGLFFMLGQADGLRLGELMLERCPDTDRTSASVQIGVAVLRLMQADAEGARTILADALESCRKLGERDLEGWALFFQGLAATFGGPEDAAREALSRARELHHELGISVGEGRAIAAQGLLELRLGNPELARKLVDEALEVQTETGDRFSQGQCQLYLGMIAEDATAPAAHASARYEQAIDSLRPYGAGPLLPIALAFQGGVVGHSDAKRGLRIIAAATAIRAKAGGEFAPVFKERLDRRRAAAEAALGAEAAAVWAEGARLGVDEAIAVAFGSASPRGPRPAELTEREAEVARLVADGLQNKAIAAKLHLSVRTVESHVRNALAKAGVENRTQLATWARERIQ